MEVRDAIKKLDFMAKGTTLLPEMQEACSMGVKALEIQEKLDNFINNAETTYDKGLAVAIKKICEIL